MSEAERGCERQGGLYNHCALGKGSTLLCSLSCNSFFTACSLASERKWDLMTRSRFVLLPFLLVPKILSPSSCKRILPEIKYKYETPEKGDVCYCRWYHEEPVIKH